MSIRFPDLAPPLVAVSACANRISLIEHPDVEPLVPTVKTEEIAALEDGSRYVKFIRERFTNGNVHFHIDLIAIGAGETPPEATTTLEDIQRTFGVLLGKTLFINFASRFVIAAKDIPRLSFVTVLKGVGMKFNNTNASLSSANVRLEDSVFTEIRWRQVGAGGSPPDAVIEIFGRLGQMPVSQDLMKIAMGRAIEGLHRFVMPPLRREVKQD